MDGPPAREPLRPAGLAASVGAFVEQGDDPAIERVDLVADPRQLRAASSRSAGVGGPAAAVARRVGRPAMRASEPLGDRLERDW